MKTSTALLSCALTLQLFTSIVVAQVLDCEDIFNAGNTASGVYTLRQSDGTEFQAYCAMDIPGAGGGWMLALKQHSFSSGPWNSDGPGNLGHASLLHLEMNASSPFIAKWNKPEVMLFVVADGSGSLSDWVMTPGFNQFQAVGTNRYCFSGAVGDDAEKLRVSEDFPYRLWGNNTNIMLTTWSTGSAVIMGNSAGYHQFPPSCWEIHCQSQRHGRYNGQCQNGNAGIGSWYVFTAGSFRAAQPNPRPSLSYEPLDATADLYNVSIDFGKPVQGFSVADIVIANGTLASFAEVAEAGGARYTVQVTPLLGSQSIIFIDVPADSAVFNETFGNLVADTLEIQHDSEAPAQATWTVTGHPSRSPVDVTLEWDEPVELFGADDIQAPDGVTIQSFAATGDDTTFTFQVAHSGGAGQRVALTIGAETLRDYAGNANAEVSSGQLGRPRIAWVDPLADAVGIRNYGATLVDVTGLRLCSSTNCSALGDVMGSADVVLNAGQVLTVSDWVLNDTASDVTLLFDAGTEVADFMQYGGADQAREDDATSAGLWTAGEFVVDRQYPLQYVGDGFEAGAQYWRGHRRGGGSSATSGSISGGAVAGIVLALLFTTAVVIAAVIFFKKRRQDKQKQHATFPKFPTMPLSDI